MSTPNGRSSPGDVTQELGSRPASGVVVPVGGLVAPSGSMAELRRRRHELAERVAALTWDLGGLTYEMAIRDHYRLDVLARKAAELQEAEGAAGRGAEAARHHRGGHPRAVPLLRRGAQSRRRLLLALRRRPDGGGASLRAAGRALRLSRAEPRAGRWPAVVGRAATIVQLAGYVLAAP